MSDFIKVSSLTPKDRKKIKDYWSNLNGEQFASDQTKDYKPQGSKIQVKAEKQEEKKIS